MATKKASKDTVAIPEKVQGQMKDLADNYKARVDELSAAYNQGVNSVLVTTANALGLDIAEYKVDGNEFVRVEIEEAQLSE